MATAEISIGQVMGAGAPTYAPPRASQSLATTTSNTAASLTVLDGDYATVTPRGSTSGQYVAISKTAASAPRLYVPEGQSLDIGPLKAGDTINVADVA